MGFEAGRFVHILTTLFLLFVAPIAAVAQPVATIASLEGRPEVARDNRFLLSDIEQGFRFEKYDYIETNENTIVSLDVLPRGGSPGRIIVESTTALILLGYAEEVDGEAPLEVELFTGSISVSSAPVVVHRPRVSIDGTNAEFSVISGPGGGTLVIATDGIVSVTTDENVQLFAEAGDAVEIGMVGDLARTREYERTTAGSFPLFWLAERRSLLDSCIESHTEVALRRYDEAVAAWEDAYAALISERDALDEWAEQDRRGRVESIAAEDYARIEVIMEEARRQLVAYRHSVATLESLAETQPLIVAEVSVPSGLDGAQALQEIEDERLQMGRWLRQTLYSLKLFEERPQALSM
ncbi:MAG: hypothetical protein ACLFP4_04265 [Spirochaetales bacterium]